MAHGVWNGVQEGNPRQILGAACAPAPNLGSECNWYETQSIWCTGTNPPVCLSE